MSHQPVLISRRRLLAALSVVFAVRVHAQGLDGSGSLLVPAGLRFQVPRHLDLTYQIVPSYDETEKVIAAWSGERLQFFVAISALPAGHTDAQGYHAGMARDLRSAWGDLRTGRSAAYRANDGLNGSVVDYVKPSTDPDRPSTSLLVHFLTNGRVSFLATVGIVQPASVGLVFDDSVSLMRTAALSVDAEQPVRSEDAFVGAWTSEERLPDGRVASMRVELKADLSFAARVRLGEQLIFNATGVWSRSANLLHWTYLDSSPPLPAHRREDVDTVVAADRNLIILRSRLSGKERSLRRSPNVAK